MTNDHLGSPRINTDANGAVITRHDYHPFGEEIVTPQRTFHAEYVSDLVRKQFTGYERDVESNLDFAEARYYNPASGRFTTTDPIQITDERLIDPQQINPYLYSRNNPLKYTDSSGLEIEIKGKEKDWALEKMKEDVSFGQSIGTNKGKLAISNGRGGFLDPAEKDDKAILDAMAVALKEDKDIELFKAIIDPSSTGVLEATTKDNRIDIGSELSVGVNGVDRAEAETVEEKGKNKGGLTAAEIVKHEAMEAYATSKSGKSVDVDPSSHNYNAYSGLTGVSPRPAGPQDKSEKLVALPLGGKGRGRYEMTKVFDGNTRNKGGILIRTGSITNIKFKR